MDFGLAPPNGVGPLRIGMTRQSANAALDSFRDLSAVSESDRPGQHIFRPSGLMISIHCMRDMLEAIELGRPSTQTDRVVFRGLDVFAIPARELVQRMGEFTSIEADPDDLASFVASDLLLSFWRPFGGRRRARGRAGLLLQFGPAGTAWLLRHPCSGRGATPAELVTVPSGCQQDSFEERPQSGHAAPVARPLAVTSTVPKAAVTASTSTSSIPSNTSESQNAAPACMTSTVTARRGRQRGRAQS